MNNIIQGPDYILQLDRKHYTIRESGSQSPHTAPERHIWRVGSVRTPWVSFSDILAPGEKLVDPPTVTELVSSDLTIDFKAVSSQSLTIDQEAVAAGRAVTFRSSGHIKANAPYTVRITVSTDSAPKQTFVKDLVFEVES